MFNFKTHGDIFLKFPADADNTHILKDKDSKNKNKISGQNNGLK